VGTGDGWLVLAPAESAPLLLPEPGELSMTPLHGAVLTALSGGGGMFFRMLSDRVAAVLDGHPADDGELVAALWDLVWSGLVSNDTLAPLRVVLSGGGTGVRRQSGPRRAGGGRLDAASWLDGVTDAGSADGEPGSPRQAGDGGAGLGRGTLGGPRAAGGYGGRGYGRGGSGTPGVFNPRPAARRSGGYGGYGGGLGGGGRTRRPAMPSRTGPPTVSGRWSLLPERVADAGGAAATMRAHALALSLLERHGVVTKGAVAAERVPGGFAAVYPVLRAMEDTGQCRRGYFVEGLGGAQFALPGAVDRMRALAGDLTSQDEDDGIPRRGKQQGQAVVLAAGDPAQPYGAALAWPERPGETTAGHRPGRKAGAVVVLFGGELVLYVERGGKTLLSWTEDSSALEPCALALAAAVRDGALGRMTVEKADGATVHDTPLARALTAAGFRATPRGLRLRG
jgi:ATP-dependent Lhr-like helicase